MILSVPLHSGPSSNDPPPWITSAHAAQVTVKLSDSVTNAQLLARLTDPSTDDLVVSLDSSTTTSWSSFACRTLTMRNPATGSARANIALASVKVSQTVVLEGGDPDSTVVLDQLEVGNASYANVTELPSTAVDVQAPFAGQLRITSSRLYARSRGVVSAGTVGVTISATTVQVVGQEGTGIEVLWMPSTTLSIVDNDVTATEHGIYIVGPQNAAADGVPNNVEVVGNTINISGIKPGSVNIQDGYATGVTLGNETHPMSGKFIEAFRQTTIALLTSISRNTITITTVQAVSCVGISFFGRQRNSSVAGGSELTTMNLTVNHNTVTLYPPPEGGALLTSEPNAMRILAGIFVAFSVQYNRVLTPEPIVFRLRKSTVNTYKRFRAFWIARITLFYTPQLGVLGYAKAPAVISNNFVNLTNVSMPGEGGQAVNAFYLGSSVTLTSTAAELENLLTFTTGLHIVDNEIHVVVHHGQSKVFVYEDLITQLPFFLMARNTIRSKCSGCNVSYGIATRPALSRENEAPPLVTFEANDIVTDGIKLSVPLRLNHNKRGSQDITSIKSHYVFKDNVLTSNTSGPPVFDGVVAGIQADGGMAYTNVTVVGNAVIGAGLGKSQAVGFILVPLETSFVVIANNTMDQRATSLAAGILFGAMDLVENVLIEHNTAILVSGGGSSFISLPTDFHNTTSFVVRRNTIRTVANPSGSLVVVVDTYNVSTIEIVDNSLVASVDTPDPRWCYHPRTKVGFSMFMSFDPGLSKEFFNAKQQRMEGIGELLIARNSLSVTTPCFSAIFASQYIIQDVTVVIENNTMRVRPPSWAGPVDCLSSFDACLDESREETFQESSQYLPMSEKIKRSDILNRGLLLTPVSRRINTTGASIATVYGDVGSSNSIRIRFNEVSVLSGAPVDTVGIPSVVTSSGSLMAFSEQDIGTWATVPSEKRVALAKTAVRDQRAYAVDMSMVNFGMDNVLSPTRITGDRVGSALDLLPLVRVRMRGNTAHFVGGRSATVALFDGAPDVGYGGEAMLAHTAFMFGVTVSSRHDDINARAAASVAALVAGLRSTNTTTHLPPDLSDKCSFHFINTTAVLETAGSNAVIALAVGRQVGRLHIEDAMVRGRLEFVSPSSQQAPDASSPGQTNGGEHIAQQRPLTVAVAATMVVAPTFSNTTATPPVAVSSSTLEEGAATMEVVLNRSSVNITSLVEDEAAANAAGFVPRINPRVLTVREPATAAPAGLIGLSATRPASIHVSLSRLMLHDQQVAAAVPSSPSDAADPKALVDMPPSSPVWAAALTNISFVRSLIAGKPRLFADTSIPVLNSAGQAPVLLSCTAFETYLPLLNRTRYEKIKRRTLERTEYADSTTGAPGVVPAGLYVDTDCVKNSYCLFPFDHIDPLALECISFTATATASPTALQTATESGRPTATRTQSESATALVTASVSVSVSETFLPAQLVADDGARVLYSALLAAKASDRVMRVAIENSSDTFDAALSQPTTPAPGQGQHRYFAAQAQQPRGLQVCSVGIVLHDEDRVPLNERMTPQQEAAYLRGDGKAVSVFAAIRATLRNVSLTMTAANGSSAEIHLPQLKNIPKVPTVAGDGSKFAPLHRTVRFSVEVSRRCFSKRSEATAVNFTIPATAEPAGPQVVTSLTLGTTSVGGAVSAMLGSGATGPVAVRLGALAAMAACDMDDPEPPDIASSPTQAAIGTDRVRFHIGTAVYDTAIVAGLFVLNFAAAVLCSVFGRCSFWEGCSKAQFPSLSAFPYLFFLQPVLEAAILAAVFGEALWARAAGAAIGLLHVAAFAAISYLLVFNFQAVFQHAEVRPAPRASCELGWRSWFRYGAWAVQGKGEWVDVASAVDFKRPIVSVRDSDSETESDSSDSGFDSDDDSPIRKTSAKKRKRGKDRKAGGEDDAEKTEIVKEDRSFVQRYALLFSDYTDRCRWFFVVEGVIAIVLAGVTVTAVSAGCEVTSWALTVAFSSHFVALLAFRCFVSTPNYLFVAFLSVLQALAALLIAIDAQVAVEGPDDGGHLLTVVPEEDELSSWLVAAEYVILIVALTTVARAIFDIIETFVAVATAYAGPAAAKLKKLWFWRPEWASWLAFADPDPEADPSVPRDFAGDALPIDVDLEKPNSPTVAFVPLLSQAGGDTVEVEMAAVSDKPRTSKPRGASRSLDEALLSAREEMNALVQLQATLAQIDVERQKSMLITAEREDLRRSREARRRTVEAAPSLHASAFAAAVPLSTLPHGPLDDAPSMFVRAPLSDRHAAASRHTEPAAEQSLPRADLSAGVSQRPYLAHEPLMPHYTPRLATDGTPPVSVAAAGTAVPLGGHRRLPSRRLDLTGHGGLPPLSSANLDL